MSRNNSSRSKANKKVTRDLLDFLTANDFTTHVRRALSTDSTYIKMDYGASYSLRISDHRGNPKYDYRFNLMLGMTPRQVEQFRNQLDEPKYPRFFFAESEIDILKQAILLTLKQEATKGPYVERYNDCKRLFNLQANRNSNSFAALSTMHHQRARMPQSFEKNPILPTHTSL